MLFVIVGAVLIALNLAGIGPVGLWSWDFTGDLWKFCLPFALAVAWWAWAESSGLDRRREMERVEARKVGRRRDNLAALGLDTRARRKAARR